MHQQPSGRGGGIHRLGQGAESDASVAEVPHNISEVPDAAAQPIEPPDDEGVPGSAGRQSRREPRAVSATAAHAVGVGVSRIHTDGAQSISLQVKKLFDC